MSRLKLGVPGYKFSLTSFSVLQPVPPPVPAPTRTPPGACRSCPDYAERITPVPAAENATPFAPENFQCAEG